MKEKFPLEKMDLVLFENKNTTGHDENAHHVNQLKDFIGFLKLYKYPGPLRFSHVESSGPLIENLSLEENLLLHASGNTGITEITQVAKVLEETGNHYLVDFFNKIKSKSLRPSQVDNETRKSVALVKALIHPGDFLFLENPESLLGEEMLNLFIQALVYKTATSGQISLVSTTNKQLWRSHFTKHVFRNNKNLFEIKHYSCGIETALMNKDTYNKKASHQSEGYLKIVNPNNEESDREKDNKKAA